MAKKGDNNNRTVPDSPFSFGDRSTFDPGAVQVPGQREAADDRQRAAQFDGGSEHISAEGMVFAKSAAPEIGPDYGARRRLRPKRDEVSVYNDQMRERYALDPRLRTTVILLLIAVALVPLMLILPTNVFGYGDFETAVVSIGRGIAGRVNALGELPFDTPAGKVMAIHLWQVVAVACAGGALALNGAVYQGTLKNALASPSTLGVMSGATLGTVLYALFALMPTAEEEGLQLSDVGETAEYLAGLNPLEYIVQTQAQALCSIAGSLAVVALVLIIAVVAGRGRMSKVGLLIAGQVFTAVIASAIEMIHYYLRDNGTEQQVSVIRGIVGGSFDYLTGPLEVAVLAVPVAVGVIIVMALRNRLNLLAFDDDEARSMGMSVTLTRNVVIVVCTVLTAIVVAYCGAVGFVGFIVPHLARKMVGTDFRYLIPASVCLGAAYLMVAYYLADASVVFRGSVGTLTSLIGVVFFIVMACRQRARGNVDWI